MTLTIIPVLPMLASANCIMTRIVCRFTTAPRCLCGTAASARSWARWRAGLRARCTSRLPSQYRGPRWRSW